MKIGILSFQSLTKRATKEEIRLKNEAKALGHKSRIFRIEKCQIVYHPDHPRVTYDGKPFPEYDVLIPRVSLLSNIELNIAVVKQFQLMGFPVVNTYYAISRAKNKLRTMQILEHENIPIPRTVVIRHLKYLDSAVRQVGGLPVIMKTPFGSYGAGVVIAESKRAVVSALDFLWKSGHGNLILIQEFIRESRGRDIRAFVVGNRVVGSMMRCAVRGEFRSNMELGAEAIPVELTSEEERLAVKACKALKLDIGGVDFVRSVNGPLILEVNANAGFKALEEITGKNIAAETVKYAVKKAQKKMLAVEEA